MGMFRVPASIPSSSILQVSEAMRGEVVQRERSPWDPAESQGPADWMFNMSMLAAVERRSQLDPTGKDGHCGLQYSLEQDWTISCCSEPT